MYACVHIYINTYNIHICTYPMMCTVYLFRLLSVDTSFSSQDGESLTLVELPRVQLRFAPGPDPAGRGLRLFSKEFGGWAWGRRVQDLGVL